MNKDVRVLVVGHHPIQSSRLADLLRTHGYVAEVALRPDQATAYITGHEYQVVVLSAGLDHSFADGLTALANQRDPNMAVVRQEVAAETLVGQINRLTGTL